MPADLHDDTKADLDATLRGLQLSNQEVDKFTKAFKDPEFMKLFEEYAREVSDPKVKQETDLYLRQLEAEGRGEDVYGQGVLLIVPSEAFLVKTHEKGTNTKAYVNVCTSDKLEKLSFQASTGPSGQKGQQVNLPFSLSQKKTGQDKDGNSYLVWDVVFHPDTVAQAKSNPIIKKLIIETAIENIKSAHNVELSMEFKMLKATYKGTPEAPKPHVLTTRTNSNNNNASQGGQVKPVGNAPAVAGMPAQAGLPAAGKPAPSATSTAVKGSGPTRSSFKFPKPSNKKEKALSPHQPGYQHASGEVTPHWELIHRGQVDLGECWGDAGRSLAAPPVSYPTHLVLRVELPGCRSATGVELDVGTRLASITLPGKFKLDAPLPFPVDDSLGKAKFDKATCQLEITLPTLPAPKPIKSAAPSVNITEDSTTPASSEEQTAADELVDQKEGMNAGNSQQNVVTGSCAQQETAVEDNKDGDLEHQAEQQIGSEGTVQAACKADNDTQTLQGNGVDGMTENQRRWAELHAQEAQQVEKESVSVSQPDDDSKMCVLADSKATVHVCDVSVDEFRACNCWEGAQLGFVFKLGTLGLGYYRDVRPHAHVQQQQGNRQGLVQQQSTVQLQPRLQCNIADELD